jgi:hypothetical protein
MARDNPEKTFETFGNRYEQFGFPPTYSSNTSEWWRTYASLNTPGYPGVSLKPFNPHYVSGRRALLDPVFRAESWKSPYSWWKYQGSAMGQGIAYPNRDGHIDDQLLFGNKAEVMARAKVIRDIQRIKANVAQNIAEYRQVHGMFHTNVRRVANAYRALRHGDVKALGKSISLRKRHKQSLLSRGPLNIRSSAPSVWLELQYGWLPLVGDVYTGLTQFYSRVESGYAIRARGRSTQNFSEKIKFGNDVGIVTFDDRTAAQARCLYIIEYEVDNTQLANLDDWGITNPALLAWELVPYSFVVDWFYPVGDWLSQVGYSLGLHFRRGMRTGKFYRHTTRGYKPIAHATQKRTVSGTDIFETWKLRRELVSGFPDPRKPTFDKDGLRGKRIFNALSLLSLAFDRQR